MTAVMARQNSERMHEEALARLNEALDSIETQAELLHRDRHERGMTGQFPTPNQRRRLMRLMSMMANAQCAAYRELKEMGVVDAPRHLRP